MKNRYEDEILENEQQKKTILELNNIVDNLHSKLDNFETDLFEVTAMKTSLADELEETVVECHELKVSNNMFLEKLQKAEADHIEFCNTVKQEKDTLSEKVEFLVSSIKRSTEETLSMEKKFDDGKKVVKKHKNEICLLKQELNILEQSNKKLEEQNYNLQSDQKLSEPNSSPLHGALSKSCKTDFPTRLEKITTPSSQQTAPTVTLASNPRSSKSKTFHSPSSNFSLNRKPFPPVSEFKKTFPSSADVHPGKPFPHASELKKIFPPTRDLDPGNPFPHSQESNNNSEDLNRKNETFGEYDVKKAT